MVNEYLKKESFHTHIGVIKHSDAIGKEYGSRLMTNKDKYVYLLEPTMYDYVMKIQHGTQIVYQRILDILLHVLELKMDKKY